MTIGRRIGSAIPTKPKLVKVGQNHRLCPSRVSVCNQLFVNPSELDQIAITSTLAGLAYAVPCQPNLGKPKQVAAFVPVFRHP